ncbi:MAG: GAF domain-containing sensor histidine kinase [Gemmatimonadetes bacterium]|nr:GAF domain-containing sensor histidine kinase [Gemmatimonadota bacterium]
MPRLSALHSERARPNAGAPVPAQQELGAVREIVLTADEPREVFQFALDRVLPLVGASFASVYLVDGASELMRLVAASNWPDAYQPWLGQMRVRVGFGPSGEAVSERRPIEIPHILADPSLEDWAEVAQEIGFRALVALPLTIGRQVLGTATFYFAEPGSPGGERRALLKVVADQLAATAEKAALVEELARTKAALADANEELEAQYVAVHEARRVKEEFLANISHELRTPLTAVLGYLAILEEGVSGPLTTEQASDLAQVRASSERLVALINNLLELTSLKQGALPVMVEEFDPREPLRDAIAMTPGRSTDVLLRVDEPEGAMPSMRSDKGKLARILAELLGNAYKFTRRGEVTVSAAVVDGRGRYVVQDTGIGIPLDAQAMVFDEFRQVDGSATRRYGGSGLGLALARRLARLLGGDIALESVEGAGTTFTLELPLEYEEPRRARALAMTPR